MIIKLQETEKVFSSYGGMLCLRALHDKFDLNSTINDHLPQLKSNPVKGFKKFEGLMLGLQAGAECLDDMDKLAQDEGFSEVCNQKVYTAKAYGDFLRSFSNFQCKQLNHDLIDLGYKLRSSLFIEQKSITFEFDSTSNEQYGKKMEGVELNYKGVNCLDTIVAFDERGIQYWNDVRPGSTFTSQGSGEIVHAIFSRMPSTYKEIRRYARADSGFSNSEFFNACFAKNVGFVVCLRQNMFQPLVANIREWNPQNLHNEKRIRFYDGRECEMAETLYVLDNCPHVLRVVGIRALKREFEGREHLFCHEEHYDYYAWVTSIGSHEMDSEEIIKFYRQRGQMENFIKELKYGFDLKHYPCLKLVANKAYGLIAAFAYNFIRFLSLMDNAKNPQYAKAIRFRIIHKPVQIVRHARQVVFQFMKHHFREVSNWLDKITHIQLGYTT